MYQLGHVGEPIRAYTRYTVQHGGHHEEIYSLGLFACMP